MSLDRAAVIRNTKQLLVTLGLKPEEMIVTGGAALVLYGLRKHANGLDVSVPKEFFEKHKARKGAKPGIMGEHVEWDGITDLHPMVTELFAKKISTDFLGIHAHTPQYLLLVKETLVNHVDRDPTKAAQDLKDIKAIKELLQNIADTREQFNI